MGLLDVLAKVMDPDSDKSSGETVKDEVVKSLFIPGYGILSGVDMVKNMKNDLSGSALEERVQNYVGSAKDSIKNGLHDWIYGRNEDGSPGPSLVERVGDSLSDLFGNAGNGSGAGIGNGRGSGYGSGSIGRSVSGAVSASQASQDYLDMLHQEQERVWQREDTAYQRTVKDLQASGLNPVLAVNSGISSSNSSAGSDSQVVGAVADLAAMAISGLTETAKSIGSISAASQSNGLFNNLGSWFQKNGRTLNTAVNTASGLVRLIKLL